MHSNADNLHTDTEEESFSFTKMIGDWWDGIRFALGYWKLILLLGVIGGLLGLAYSFYKKPTYTARLSFVVEDAKGASGGGSIASALAGQLGFDIGGLAGTSGVLAGDNVTALLKSESLIRKTLRTSVQDSSATSLADMFADSYRLKEKWANTSEVNRRVNFPAAQTPLPRLEDSLLQVIIKKIGDEILSVGKPDKKLGFFEMQVTSRNETFSKIFCERLLKITTDFYVSTKTRRLVTNVTRLQRRADSLGAMLDQRTYSAAEASQLLLDANPAYSSPSVTAEISTRNKFIQSTVYAEIIKNLEVSKTSLIQETPTVQIVDNPELPLKKNRIKPVSSAAGGLMITMFLATLILAAFVGPAKRRK